MVVAGVPAALSQRAPSEVGLANAHSLLRLDSWRLPAPGGIPGRAGSEVFIDTEKISGPNVEPQLQTSLSYAPSEGPDALPSSDPFLNGDDKLFALQRGPSEATAPSTSAPARQPDDRAGFRLLPSPSEDERDWKATLNKAFGDQSEPALLAPRPSNSDIHAARTNAVAARALADAAAEEMAAKEASKRTALKAKEDVDKAIALQAVPSSSAPRTRPEVQTAAQNANALSSALPARRKRVEADAGSFRPPPPQPRAPASASMPAPTPRRAPAAPATNAIKRMAGGGASAEAPEPPAKKHRSDQSLAQQETPITDAAMKMMRDEGLTLNSVKATDHWTDPSGRKCRRGCLYCNMQKTPQWRQGPLGPKTLCNACGVRYRKEVEILAARTAQ